jgi:hypothetical protein
MSFLMSLSRQVLLSRLRLRRVAATCSAVVLLAACSDGGNLGTAEVEQNARDYCSELQSAHCLYPFPSNIYTRQDGSTPTGLRVNLSAEALPKNASGVVVDPAEWNRNDGFSPGTTMLAQVPGLDVARTGLPTLAHQQRSLDADSPVVVIDAQSGERQLVWAELNSDPLPTGEVALLIHPARSFDYGHRYIVALRNMKNNSGAVIDAEAVFRAYRDGTRFTNSILEDRRAAFDDILARLADAGVNRDGLFLAWDFTVASSDSISRRIVHMRDETLTALDGAPAITITSVTPGEALEDEDQQLHLARLVRGTIDVPNYLNAADGGPGARLHYGSNDADALPTRRTDDAVLKADFVCAIPKSAMTAPADEQQRARPVIMAHGLFQNREMVPRFAVYADTNNVIPCGMNWLGMTSDDAAITAEILADFGKFPTLVDRLQQAYLNNMLLTRALMADDGFAALTAFRNDSRNNGQPLFNNDEVYFEGISQGSVLGGGFYAVSPDIRYGSLVAAGMNFSLLMQRSDAWPTYRKLFTPAYKNGLDQSLLLAMVQMLWDRGEINGYAATLNSANAGVPGTPQKLTLIQAAVGDKTVTETAAEILARTIGALQHAPRTVGGRHIGDVPYINIDVITYPSIESGYTVWDRGPFPYLLDGEMVDGTPLQLEINAPNMLGENPHDMPIRDPLPSQQRAALIWEHRIINVCGGNACLAEGYDGTPGVYDPVNAPTDGETVSM